MLDADWKPSKVPLATKTSKDVRVAFWELSGDLKNSYFTNLKTCQGKTILPMFFVSTAAEYVSVLSPYERSL